MKLFITSREASRLRAILVEESIAFLRSGELLGHKTQTGGATARDTSFCARVMISLSSISQLTGVIRNKETLFYLELYNYKNSRGIKVLIACGFRLLGTIPILVEGDKRSHKCSPWRPFRENACEEVDVVHVFNFN